MGSFYSEDWYDYSKDPKTGAYTRTDKNVKPTMPKFVPFTQTYDAFANGSSASKLRGYANGEQESPWIAMAREKNKLMDVEGRDKIMGQGQAGAAMAADNLAMQGGLTSGAQERLAGKASTDVMDRMQDLGRQSAQREADLGIEGGRERMNILGQVAGMEQQGGMFNTKMAQDEARRKSDYDMDLYGHNAELYGNEKMARATEKAGNSGSSFICTELRRRKLMSSEETRRMTDFMLGGVLSRADFFVWYLRHGQAAVNLANRANFDWSRVKAHFVDDLLALLSAGKNVEAQNLYVERAIRFVVQFLGFDACHPKMNMARPGWLKAALYVPRLLTHPTAVKWALAHRKRAAQRSHRALILMEDV